ncbi:MAG: thioredoxin fold domain-containing protein [Muribaculaceae bacterium]|nr:thioredoxin fold domain-containing protein [Muribaculaceae bacterium]
MRKYFIIACLFALAAITGNAKTANFQTGVINTLHSDEFNEMFNDGNTLGKPVVIDVSAEWCGWCKKMHPHLETLAKKYKGQIYFFQINYETDLDLIRKIGVSSYPTLIYILPDGSGYLDEEGFRTADQLDITLQEMFFGED